MTRNETTTLFNNINKIINDEIKKEESDYLIYIDKCPEMKDYRKKVMDHRIGAMLQISYKINKYRTDHRLY